MNLSIKIFIGFFLFFTASYSLLAHSPYEISYEIKVNQAQPTLTVHLTPKTALDLVSYLKTELADQEVIKLDDYIVEYTQYINDNLLLLADGQTAKYNFQQANLSQHDATLLFTIDETPEFARHFNITANCFTDIYRRPQNIVKLQLPSGQQTFYLNSQNRQCATSVKVVAAKMNRRYTIWAIGLLLFVGISIWVRRTLYCRQFKYFIRD